jgi:hypothetical protein
MHAELVAGCEWGARLDSPPNQADCYNGIACPWIWCYGYPDMGISANSTVHGKTASPFGEFFPCWGALQMVKPPNVKELLIRVVMSAVTAMR